MALAEFIRMVYRDLIDENSTIQININFEQKEKILVNLNKAI